MLIERGGSPRPIESYISKNGTGYNWIKIGDADETGYINKTEEKIKASGLTKTRKVFKGDLILSNSMSFGRPYILNIDGCIHDGWLLLRDRNKVFNILFLKNYLETSYCLKQYQRTAAGGVVSNLNKDIVSNVTINYPIIQEQNKISIFFELLDLKIQILKFKINALKKYKKGIIDLWFKRPGKKVKLCRLVNQQTSQLLTSQIKDNHGDYPVYDVSGNIYKTINFYENPNDSIAIIKYGSGCGRTFISKNKHSVLGTMTELIPFCSNDLLYIFSFTESIQFKKACKKYTEVGTTPNLYYSDYSNEMVFYPQKINVFVQFIDLMTKKYRNLEAQRNILNKLKLQFLKDMFI